MKKLLLTSLSCLALGAMATPAGATIRVVSATVSGTNWVNYFGSPSPAVDPVTLDFTVTLDDAGTVDPTDTGLVIHSFNLPYPLFYTNSGFSLVIATVPHQSGSGCTHTASSFCVFIADPWGSPFATFMEQSPPSGGGWRATKLVQGPLGVPEPASWALMIGGLALAGGALRRSRVSARFA